MIEQLNLGGTFCLGRATTEVFAKYKLTTEI